MNPWSTPERIGFALVANQIADVFRHRGSPGSPVPTLPSPKQTETLAMPCDDGVGFDENESRAPIGPDARQPSPEDSVRRPESGSVGG